MKHVGIICEYNPLHAGHALLLDRVREAQTVICLMSGYFTQRAEAAVLPPHARAAMALAAGADLVLELPFPYAAGSARYFATGAVRALSGLCVDTLAFGSECASKERLIAGAQRTLEADFELQRACGDKSKGGAALYFEALGKERVLSNDILALEYTRAVLTENSGMILHPIQREGAGYHDTDVQKSYPSATALRLALRAGQDITPLLPLCVQPYWQTEIQRFSGIADTARLGKALLAMLRRLAADREKYPAMGQETADCGGGLLERLIAASWEATDYAELCRMAATKKYTDGRIRRALLYLLAGVRYADLEAAPAYVRLLGANERGRAFLGETRRARTVPVITKPAELSALGANVQRARALEAMARGLYALCLPSAVSPRDLATAPPLML